MQTTWCGHVPTNARNMDSKQSKHVDQRETGSHKKRMEMDENKGRGQKSFKLLREVFEQIEEIEKKQVDGEKVKPIVIYSL